MRVKQRTLNELRQTKDSHYVAPRHKRRDLNSEVVDDYIRKMKADDRLSQVSVVNFLYYLAQNNLKIVQG